MEEVNKQAKEKMEKTLESLKHDFASIRTGRASLAILEPIRVEAYGTMMKLDQVASLSVPDSRLITIQPWDPQLIPVIEKAIIKSDIGINPSNDGKLIRLAIPQLTEERRKQIVKVVNKRGEEAKISIRNIRREANDELKKMEKDNHISSDEIKKGLDEIQKLTDSYIKKIDETREHKDAEVMEI
jgi:ribosome recycling factor